MACHIIEGIAKFTMCSFFCRVVKSMINHSISQMYHLEGCWCNKYGALEIWIFNHVNVTPNFQRQNLHPSPSSPHLHSSKHGDYNTSIRGHFNRNSWNRGLKWWDPPFSSILSRDFQGFSTVDDTKQACSAVTARWHGSTSRRPLRRSPVGSWPSVEVSPGLN